MDIYKEAAKLKIRIQTSRGPLSPEQLFDLKMSELAKLCKAQNEVVKKSRGDGDEELSFLDGPDTKVSDVEVLKFELLKDVYLDKKHQKEQDAEDVKNKLEIAKLDELIAQKQDEELKGLSVEELMKRREALLKK